jgi:catechol 2,3-dioxygenase-like lactoylglutathione lyase family enzyme
MPPSLAYSLAHDSLGDVRLNHILLPCSDVERSLAFYRCLGLTPIVRDHLPDGTLRYARLIFPDGDATLSLEQGPPAGPGVVVYLESDDLDAQIATLVAAGIVLSAGPEMKPWFWREATLSDPDGHRLCLYQAGSYRRDPPWRLSSSVVARTTAEVADLGSFLTAHNRGYVDTGIPSARDVQIGAYLQRLMSKGIEERDQAANALGPAHTDTFLSYGERMATLSARERNPHHALLGVLAVALTWRRCLDVRPAIPILGLLYDAAKRAGGEPDRVFVDAAALCPADVAPVLRDFLTRADLDQIADEMGFSDGQDRDGFRYRRTWGTGGRSGG